MLLNWDTESSEIVSSLRKRKGYMKIVLKTRDERFLLEGWIKHHAAIVGLENLIIADNGSTDQSVMDIYQQFAPELFVFSVSGKMNLIHSLSHYRPLYEALEESCLLRLFLDTDERLVWLDEDRWYAGRELFERIRLLDGKRIIPTGLLQNALGSDRIFYFFPPERFRAIWLWGKPIIPSSLAFAASVQDNGITLHNCQFKKSAFDGPITTNVNILHLANLIKEQRLRANKNKLVAFGVAQPDETYEAIAARPIEGPLAQYTREIKKLLIWDGIPPLYNEQPAGTLRLGQSGEMEFANEKDRQTFVEMMINSDLHVRSILTEHPE